MSERNIPKTKLAFIGGSSTFAINFPEDLRIPGVRTIEKKTFTTPFGESPEFTVFEISGDMVLTVKMHGWRPGVKRAEASRQVFWVFEQAGVKNILAEGGVGTVQKDFKLRDFIVPDDYIDFSMRKDISLSDKYLLIMRNPICPELAKSLMQTSRRMLPEKRVNRGVYVTTDGGHFESRAEVKMIEKLGGNVIGQSLCPEVYLAREIGACYAGIYLIVNRAEGVEPIWSHQELKDIFYHEAGLVGKIIVASLEKVRMINKKNCKCISLRKETLLNLKNAINS